MIGPGFALCAVAGVLGWLAPWRRGFAGLAWTANVLAAIAFAVAGGLGLAGHDQRLSLGTLAELGSVNLSADRLSGLFLLISFAVAVPVLTAAAAPAHPLRPRLAAAAALCQAAVALVMTTDNLFALLFGWEALTVAFYLLTGFDRARPAVTGISVRTVTFGKVSGAALLLGTLLLASRTHSFAFAATGVDPRSCAGQCAFALMMLGFATKVGLLPMQVWMPPSYASAPGPVRALMAGVAVNVGYYGMWRTLMIFGSPPTWLSCVVLIAGGITAIMGIAHAAVHPDLSVLIGWSSVENAGIITAGFGVAMVGASAGQPKLVAAGLVAGSAQVIAHSLGKTALFVSTAAIEEHYGTTELDKLRGVIRRLPWAGTGLLIGSLTLAGLPLTAGFASEWFTLESLMQQFRVDSLATQLSTAVAGALVALTVGVAGVTFVRVVALTVFGPQRPDDAQLSNAIDRQWPHRCGVALLVLGCLVVSALAPLEVRVIRLGLEPIVGDVPAGANAQPWVLQPVYADFSALSPTWLYIVLPLMVILIAGVTALLSRGRSLRVRRVAPWSSASPGVERGLGYTSFAYSNPVRRVLATLLLTRSELRGLPENPSVATQGHPDLTYRVEVIELVDRYFYRPLGVALRVISRTARRLQSGRLDAYMAYMLIALLAVLAVVIASSQ